MAKYSTGSGGSNSKKSDVQNCELCGSEDTNLSRKTVSGAKLLLCSSCASDSNSDSKEKTNTKDTSSSSRTKDLINKTTLNTDDANPDSSWAEDGMEYSDQTPYLKNGYQTTVENARIDQEYTVEELAEELEISIKDIKAVENGNAFSEGVSGKVIKKLEKHLNIELEEK